MKTFKQFILEQDQVQQKRADIQKRLEAGFQNVNKDLSKMNIRPMPAADGTSKITPNDKVDYTGSRYDLGGGKTLDPAKMSDKPNPQRELGLRKDYRSPPAGYPSSIKDRLAGAEAGNEPPTPGSGPYKTKQSDPLKSVPAVPVAAKTKIIPKPKLRPTQEPAVLPPKPKLRPLDNTKQAVSIPKPKSTGIVDTQPKKQTFKQAFAAAKEGSTFEWQGKKYKRTTKKR
jgi:hypothetical protein